MNALDELLDAVERICTGAMGGETERDRIGHLTVAWLNYRDAIDHAHDDTSGRDPIGMVPPKF